MSVGSVSVLQELDIHTTKKKKTHFKAGMSDTAVRLKRIPRIKNFPNQSCGAN